MDEGSHHDGQGRARSGSSDKGFYGVSRGVSLVQAWADRRLAHGPTIPPTQALATRVKVMERACGQHCIVKMRMFAEVLILCGKEELASLADAALKRLVDLAQC